MKTFSDLKFTNESEGPMNRLWAHLYFPNGYGISVVKITWNDNGTGSGLASLNRPGFEIAVMEGNEKEHVICYDTHITSDVIQGLTDDEVTDYMRQIQELPPSDAVTFLDELKKI